MYRSVTLALILFGALFAMPAEAQPFFCPCGIGCTVTTMTSTTYSGTGGCDCVIGTSSGDTINTYSGTDGVCAGGGNDTVRGGSGADELDGEGGADTIYGDSGNDFIYGGAGNDDLFGGSGSDQVYGDSGDDCLDGGLNPGDYLKGGSGYDICINTAQWTECVNGLGSC